MVPTLSSRWDTLSPDRWSRYEQQQGFYLIDRVSGSSNLVPLPDEDQWGLLSVSPWSDAEGKSEVVGHCHSLAAALDGHPFWGLARLSLPEGRVIDRVKLDLLPSGRLCWLPERPGEILFAAGDGQFYRCGFGCRRGSRGRDRLRLNGRFPRVRRSPGRLEMSSAGKGNSPGRRPGLADPSTISQPCSSPR